MNDASPNESITPEGIVALRAELEELEGHARSEIAARIKTARELGDLKENADYHIAKEDQALLEGRIARLRQRLQMADLVEVDAGAETFAFGRTAEVRDDATGKTHVWTLVGATEADQSKGMLSVESPVGRALLGASIGKPVEIQTPGGVTNYIPSRLLD